MKQERLTANYPMPQGDMLLLCHTKAAFMDRDLTDLQKRGVTQARIDALRTQADAAGRLPSDAQLDLSKQLATQAATAQRAKVESGMATVMSQVAIVHDARSLAYKAFGSASLYNDSEGDFYVNMGHLLDWADLHVAEYAAQGLTPQQLAALRADNEHYLQTLKAQRLAESTRARATQTRQQALNAVYDELSDLCGIGQGFYKQTSVSQYDDYVLDPAEHPAGPDAKPGPGAK